MHALATVLLALVGSFRFCGQEVDPNGKYPPPDLPSFRAMEPEYKVMPVRNDDGTWTYPYRDVQLLKNERGEERPFLLNLYPRLPLRANLVLFGKFRRDLDDYRAWTAEHPGYRGCVTLEWVNDVLCPTTPGGVKNHLFRKPKPDETDFSITSNELAQVLARDEYVHGFDDRHQFVTNLLRKSYDRIVETCFDDPKRLFIGDGITCADHLVADWGAGGLAFETTRNYCFWQIQMMFIRGAAFQYGLPFHWYVASFYYGYRADGRFDGNGNQTADTPELGCSPSAVKRVSYLSYFAGADAWEREAMRYAFCHRAKTAKDKSLDGKISEEGLFYDSFYKFCRKNPRGEPYRSVALIVPIRRGYTRTGGRAFRLFAYTHADRMLDAVMSVILDFPKNRQMAAMKRGVERVMANSKYGDVFDVLCPDGERRAYFRKALPAYRVAFLIGDYPDDPEMEGALEAFVRGGGTLVVNSAQPVTRRPWVKELGVRVTEKPYWTDWYGDDEAAQERALAEIGIGEPVRFPEIERTMDELVLPTHPFKVTGDVQFGFCRRADGWLVYLLNNGGVTKFADRVATYDPNGAEVVIALGSFAGCPVRELVAEETLAEDGTGAIRLSVPSGDVRVIFIANNERKQP